VGEASAPRDRGFTLIEVLIAVAVIAMTATAGIGIALASRSFAVTAAATEFDQFLDSARTMSRDLQGATLAFAPDAYGDGTEVRLLTAGANGTLVPTTLPDLHARAVIEETESLGTPPYAFVVHANGALGGRPGFQVGGASSPEVGCPASGAFHFLVHTANASADRYVPCRIVLATTGPVALASWPPSPVLPPPTPCAGACSPAPLPTAPSSSPSCPPSDTPIPGGCAPGSAPSPTPNPGAHYHVSVSGTSPTMTVGATQSFTAQATLTNANGVAPGTPGSIPVEIQQATTGICSVTPPGTQPSGTTFTLNGLAAGSCTVTIAADTSGVAGSTADTATLTVTISAAPAPSPSPTPQGCDLTANGKCYHRIVDQTEEAFSKYVLPATQCSDPNDPGTCAYTNAIGTVQLTGYQFVPPVPPVDAGHELLIQITQVPSIFSACLPYAVVATIPGNDPIPWGGNGVGGSVNPPIGFGQPSLYLSLNHVFAGENAVNSFNDNGPWTQGTTLAEFYNAIAFALPGFAYSFTFSSSAATGAGIQWYPDFPACDVAGDPVFPGVQYGFVTAELLFEIYQASP
jgi:prepilin-type N-terminal cleavage/methylation domain-containing protein